MMGVYDNQLHIYLFYRHGQHLILLLSGRGHAFQVG